MTYDNWKATNPADEELGEAKQKTVHEVVEVETRWRGKEWRYRDYHIWYDPPPVPTRAWDWHYQHEDFDGAEDANDNRYGHCPTKEQCIGEIDDYIEDQEWKADA